MDIRVAAAIGKTIHGPGGFWNKEEKMFELSGRAVTAKKERK